MAKIIDLDAYRQGEADEASCAILQALVTQYRWIRDQEDHWIETGYEVKIEEACDVFGMMPEWLMIYLNEDYERYCAQAETPKKNDQK